MDIKNELAEIFKCRTAGPILFLGSGFSRRYIGLENWRGLLERFCVAGKDFEYYLATANGDFPTAARLLAEAFHYVWWDDPVYEASRAKNKSIVKDSTSALRIEISNYLNDLDKEAIKGNEFPQELAILSDLNIDGIITTNWDSFLEQLFPDYRVYIGQGELLLSNPQGIGEIYKIHGCATKPSSLLLTDKDYADFDDKNAYLAAKLITLFVEHPIVFIGYSLSDPNISKLLQAISTCIGEEGAGSFQNNLIFVQKLRDSEEESDISNTFININGILTPLALVKTNDFISVYEAIALTKRKIPARVLRYCKEQLYELVQSATPEDKICVVDIDEIDRKEDIEFLVGVGVASQENARIELADIGYAPIKSEDVFHDILHSDKGYDPQRILNDVIPNVGRGTKFIPVFKYLNEIGITNSSQYEEQGLELDKWAIKVSSDFRMRSYARPFIRKYKDYEFAKLVEELTTVNAANFIPFLHSDCINLEKLREFLIQNEEKIDYSTSPYASSFRKLVCLYDQLKYGW